MLAEKIKTGLKELHLPTMRNLYQQLSAKAHGEGVPYEEYLHWLIEQERQDRRERRTQRRLIESKIPLSKGFENFDLKRLPLNLERRIKSLLTGDIIHNQENLLVFGSPGSGKTHLLCAIGQHLIKEHEHRVHFTSSARLVQELLIAKQNYQLPRMIKRLTKHNALIIDDIGYIQQSKEEVEVLFTLIAECYERTSILLTSNLPFSKWENIFKDPMVTAAAIDRLIHHSVVLEMNVKSYRLEESQKKRTEEEKK